MAKTDITKPCKDKTELNILVATLLDLAVKKMNRQEVEDCLIETHRPQERQYYLAGQKRNVAACIEMGMPREKAMLYAKPNADKEVTWTLNSIHIQRKAVDIVPQRNGKAVWNVNDSDTQKLIKIMIAHGFEAGANWSKSADSPHFQINGNFSKYFYKGHTTKEVTQAIQRALGITVDGEWGDGTTKAVNAWRKSNGWTRNGKIGAKGLIKLLG